MKKILPFLILIAVFLPFTAHGIVCNGVTSNLNLCYPTFGGLDLNKNQDLKSLATWVYSAIVIISGLAAFVMLVWGGITWMSSAGSPTAISDARGRIQSALLGLLLVLASFLILQVINPELTVLNIPGTPAPKSTAAPAIPVVNSSTPAAIPAGASTLIFEADATSIRPGEEVTLFWTISKPGFKSCQAQSNPSTPQWDKKTVVGPIESGDKPIVLAENTTFFLSCSGSQDKRVTAPPEQSKSVFVSVTEKPLTNEDSPTLILTLERDSLRNNKDLVIQGVSSNEAALKTAPILFLPSSFKPRKETARFTWTPTKAKGCSGSHELQGSNSKGNSTGSADISISGLASKIPAGLRFFTISCEGENGGTVHTAIKINTAQ